ncbi:hypothetical protein GALL_522440 [mine drainage metagenome]|uniref:Uncharacterized protein n=1 Tax=mine drainage metagenome TaxID=410659 RepID=A0A1J5PRI5_9ZZZZ
MVAKYEASIIIALQQPLIDGIIIIFLFSKRQHGFFYKGFGFLINQFVIRRTVKNIHLLLLGRKCIN